MFSINSGTISWLVLYFDLCRLKVLIVTIAYTRISFSRKSIHDMTYIDLGWTVTILILGAIRREYVEITIAANS